MTTYYVDARNGSDQASGTSASQAWRSVDRVNGFDLKPGDIVLFRTGDVHQGTLEPPTSGTAEAPIVFGAYGSGPAPVFSGAVDVVDQAWTKVGTNVWSTSLPRTGWFAPEKLLIDGETANVRAAGSGGVDQPGDWAWSSGTLTVYSEGNPATTFSSVEAAMGNFGIKVANVDHIRVVGLAAEMANQGIVVRNSTGTELIDVEASDNARNGINLKGAYGTLVEGGSSHDNGIDGLGTSTKHLGHGLLFSDGATGNVVRGMTFRSNAEDGVQFSTNTGNGNIVEGSLIEGNREDGVDVKQGSQTLSGNTIEGNVYHGVLLHQKADLMTLADNVIRTGGTGNALQVADGARVASSGNVYGADESYSVRLQSDAGNASSFTRDTFVDGGRVSGTSVLLSGGSGHVFDHATFVMRESGHALQVKLAASGVTIRGSILYGDGLIQMDNGTNVKLFGNLYWGTGRNDAWVRVDGPRRLYGKDYLLDRDADGIAADPLFVDQADNDFALLPSSPGAGLGALGAGEAAADPVHIADPEPEPDTEPEPVVVAGEAPEGWENAAALAGTDGADTLVGASTSEWISGHGGRDLLKGNAGNDALFGGDGDDTLIGGGGDDLLVGGRGGDVLIGSSGIDTASYGDASSGVTVDLKISGAQSTGHGQDSLSGIENLAGSDYGDRLLGTGGANVLDGGAGDDTLTGRAGADSLLGGAGQDSLNGGGGADVLDGGTGDDRLTGGAGADVFHFAAGGGRDTITDLRAEDSIRLDGTALSSFAEVLDHAAADPAGVVIDLGGDDALVLEGVQPEDLAATMFSFG